MQVKTCSLADLVPNKYNPNRMEDDLYKVLVSNIKRDGMLQPLLVNADLVIIDGEHRWKASKEAGLTEVECVVVESSEEEAKLKSIAFNHVRGVYEFDALSSVINSLTGSVELTAIVDQTGMTHGALSSLVGNIEQKTIEIPKTDVVLPSAQKEKATIPKDSPSTVIDSFFDATTPPSAPDYMPRDTAVDFRAPLEDMFGGQGNRDATPPKIEVDFKITCTPAELKIIRSAVRTYQTKFDDTDKPSFGSSIAEICTVFSELTDNDDID